MTGRHFEAWIAHVFDHAVTTPEWYFDPDAEHWTGSPALTVTYVTRLLEDPVAHVGSYSDEQLNQGFWYLVSNGASDYMFALLDEQVPLEARLRCIRAFTDVFAKLFAVRCSPHLSHLDEPGTHALNAVCYMWWDILPVCGRPSLAAQRQIDEECLRVMERVLDLDSMPCQESALHGLGHWQRQYPRRVEQTIAGFLAKHPGLRPDLLAYAKSAGRGCVL